MKNKLIYKYRSKVKIKIVGKNIERFIKRLINNNIELLKIDYLKYNEVSILVYKDDYQKILDLKTIYDITLVDIYGIIKIRKSLYINKFLIAFVLLGIALIIFLSNIIFEIEVIHNNSEVRTFILKELENYGIKEKTFKKNFNELQVIKQNILDKYHDKIEWLEIEVIGTKYQIRLEQRLVIDNQPETEFNHVVAKKDAIIKEVIALKGEIVRFTNDYVKKGDIVINGNIILNDEVKEKVGAIGKIYGEVWYETTVEYPFIYSEIKETGNIKNKWVLKVFDKYYEFNPKFKEKKIFDTPILTHSILPIGLYKQKQVETINIGGVLTTEEAIDKALELAKEKININLKDGEYIIKSQILKVENKEDKVVLKVFFAVCEDITEYEVIRSEDNVQEDNN